MNRHDSEHIAGALREAGLEPAGDLDDARVIVYNTCCVREHAEERFYGQLSQLAGLKRVRPEVVIAVTGCVAENDGEQVFRRAPHVDLVVGTEAAAGLARLVESRIAGEGGRLCTRDASPDDLADAPSLRESPVHGWISIMTGCDNFCSYCIVPYVRGREKSRSMDRILAQAEEMAAEGVIDVTLLGQNVNSYGRDLSGELRFAELLQRLDTVGIDRIRFTTSHPKDLSSKTIGAIAASSHVCHHIHLPVQAGSSAVLARMNRHYTKEEYLQLIADVRRAIPDVALSTDVMVGFPGETERDFSDTLDVVHESRFDQVFTFMYSKRIGTPAADMPDQIAQETKQDRFRRLMESVKAGALRANEAYAGRAVDVLVEGPSSKDPSRLTGRTRTNKLVHFTASPALRHTVVPVTITAARTWFLEGRLSPRSDSVPMPRQDAATWEG